MDKITVRLEADCKAFTAALIKGQAMLLSYARGARFPEPYRIEAQGMSKNWVWLTIRGMSYHMTLLLPVPEVKCVP